MEPVTQALASLALSRAGLRRITRHATPMAVAAALAPDLDWFSSLGGAGAYLRFHRTLLHSIPGALALAAALAGAFCWFDRLRSSARKNPPLPYMRVFSVCGAAVAFHLILDLCDSTGVQLLWPFHQKWYAGNLATNLDPWILLLFVVGLLLPQLFGMVGEEIGEHRKDRPGPRRWAIVALALVAIYLGTRAMLHSRAIDELLARSYHGAEPLTAEAFPSAASPFDWRGVVATDNSIEELQITVGSGSAPSASRSLSHFKPDASPALEAAQKTDAARRLLAYARAPLAAVERTEHGFRVELRDMRFPASATSLDNIVAIIDLDSELRPTGARIEYASPKTLRY